MFAKTVGTSHSSRWFPEEGARMKAMKWPVIILTIIIIAGAIWYLQHLDLATVDAANPSASGANHPSQTKAAPEPYPISPTPPPPDATVNKKTP